MYYRGITIGPEPRRVRVVLVLLEERVVVFLPCNLASCRFSFRSRLLSVLISFSIADLFIFDTSVFDTNDEDELEELDEELEDELLELDDEEDELDELADPPMAYVLSARLEISFCFTSLSRRPC